MSLTQLFPRFPSRFRACLLALAPALLCTMLGIGEVRAQTAPSITTLSPTSGLVGTPLTITGTNFGATQGTSTVMFGSTPGTPTSWTDTQIVVPVPNVSNGPLNVSVAVAGLQSSQSPSFTVTTAFSLTGSVQTACGGNTMTMLNDGTVLVAGGYDGGGNALSSAESYSPTTGTFTSAGNMNTARSVFTAALLNNGTVLVAGGLDSSGNPLTSAELYDPVAKTFTSTGSMSTARSLHSETVLSDGTVLIAGGMDAGGNALSSAELYSPTSGTFSPIASLNVARFDFTATLLNNGLVLLAGGGSNGNVLSSAELYDPLAGTFTATGSMNTPRAIHTATPLNSGLVLVAGGIDPTLNSSATAELYDPTAGTFASTGSMNVARSYFTSTLLNNGTVLAVGGADINFNILTSAELYDPASATFTLTSGLNVARYGDSATLLDDGQVLLLGGNDVNFNLLTSAELYQPATLVPAGLVSIAVAPLAPSAAVGDVQRFTATGTFSDTSTRPLASVTWTSSDNTIVTVANDPTDRGAAFAVAFGTATITACTGSVCGSASMTVGAPNITSLSPTSGLQGAVVTVTGTGFGAIQGASTVTFNGAVATPTSWSDTQIVVPVPTGATTGPVQVTEGGIGSNTIPFTVRLGFPPSINASVSPSPNASGWNNSAVTVTFSCRPGNSAIVSCPAIQTYSSDGANQVITGTTTDANGLTATTSVTLNIDQTRPVLTVTSPTDGTVLQASAATVTGIVTDSLSGPSTATCNGAPATLSSGSFSCNISLTVGVNLVVLQATDVAGNVGGSNIHLTLTGALPAPSSLQITPMGLNMVVGETQQFTATDDHGRPRADATWTISDTTLATITPESTPILTAVAVGQVTLTASVGSVSVQTQINILGGTSLPPGTARWSFAPASGFGTQQIVQAQPVNGGTPDLYCIETGPTTLVVALTADGQQMWSAQVSGDSTRGIAGIPDGNGGVIVHLNPLRGQERFVDLDAQTGAQVWEYDSPQDPGGEPLRGVAIGADGTVYFREAIFAPDQNFPDLTDETWWLVGLDGSTGARVFRYPVPLSTLTNGDFILPEDLSQLSDPIVAPDGSVFATVVVVNQPVVNSVYNQKVSLLQGVPPSTGPQFIAINPNAPAGSIGGANLTQIAEIDFTGDPLSNETAPFVGLIGLIPDGQGGVLASWWTSQDLGDGSPNKNVNHITHMSSGGANDFVFPFPSPFQSQILPQGMVLGENGTAFATDGGTVVALDATSGSVNWSYQAPSQFSMVSSTSGNGLVGKTTDQNNLDTAVRLDPSGQVTSTVATGGTGLDYSWQGQWNAVLNGAISLIELPPIPVNTVSDWAEPGGSSSQNGKAVVHHTFGIFWCGNAFAAQGYLADSPCTQGGGDDVQWAYYPVLAASGSCPAPPSCGIDALQNFGTNQQWVGTIIAAALKSFRKAYAKYGIQVQLATQTNMNPDQEYTAYVLGDYPFPGAGRRVTTASSAVYYFALMEGAQTALGAPQNPSTGAGWLSYSPSYPPQDTAGFENLLAAIGTGIGNAAAHEIGHQLELVTGIPSNGSQGLPYMDCGLGNPGDSNRPVPIACENNDNFVYGFFTANGLPQYPNDPQSLGGMFFYGVPGGTPGVPAQSAIHWGPGDVCWLQNYVVAESCSSK
jgi:hypothetical protein